MRNKRGSLSNCLLVLQGIIRNFFDPLDYLYPRRGPDQRREVGQLGLHYLNLLVAIVDLSNW